MTKNKTERQVLQAKIKQLKLEGKIDKKFDARQSNKILSAKISEVEGVNTPGIVKNTVAKKWTTLKTQVVSFQDACNYAERKGYILQYSPHSFKLELYSGTTGKPMKFMLPRDVVEYINEVAA